MIKETDQWKLDGDCSKCRRQKYCSHICKAKADEDARKLRMAVANAIVKRLF